jgi:hypothetical protein
MPNNYGPRIVTDNLVLCLDAANPKSYPALIKQQTHTTLSFITAQLIRQKIKGL